MNGVRDFFLRKFNYSAEAPRFQDVGTRRVNLDEQVPLAPLWLLLLLLLRLRLCPVHHRWQHSALWSLTVLPLPPRRFWPLPGRGLGVPEERL